MKILLSAILFIYFFVGTAVWRALAFDFNPNNIISDFELKDKNSMSLSAIQAFLDKEESPIRNLTFADIDGATKSAAEVVYDASQRNFISPKFILTKLDHEQCLIRDCSFLRDPAKFQKALDFATGFGVCSGCDINDARIQKYKGFAKQVDALAGVQNEYIIKADESYIYGKGETFVTQDGYTITPENQATANLYTYTPYRGSTNGIGGNYFFAKLWDRYFGGIIYPDGTILKDSRGAYWLIENSMKRRYARVDIYLSSHDDADAITVSEAVLEEYEEGSEITFANYSLVRDELGDTYLLVDGKKRKIEGEDVFRKLGFNAEEVEPITAQAIAHYKAAVPITETAVYPQGALAKEEGSETLYFIQNGFKYPVFPEVAFLNYAGRQPMALQKKELDSYYSGDPQKIKEGKFVKARDGRLYFAGRDTLRPIQSVMDFIALFGEEKLSGVVEVSDEALALHTIGDPMDVSAYERNAPQVAGERVSSITYKTIWVSSDTPSILVLGKSYTIAVAFKNKSSDRFDIGEVYGKIEETGDTVSNNDIVPQNSGFMFKIPITLSSLNHTTLTFKLYAKTGEVIPGGWYQAPVTVIDPEFKASVVSRTIPVAVRNIWSRVPVTVKIVNEGAKPWTRRKTGLKMLGDNGAPSPFYDAKDWIDKETASVSLDPKKDEIQPKGTSLFKFTLNPKGLTPGVYRYRIRLWMSDKGEIVYVNGKEYLEGVIRVDG